MSREAVNYFTKISEGKCKCICGTTRSQGTGASYSNLYNHINGAHPQWKTDISASQTTLTGVTTSGKNLHGWLQLLTDCNLPFSFVE